MLISFEVLILIHLFKFVTYCFLAADPDADTTNTDTSRPKLDAIKNYKKNSTFLNYR